jgi:molybdate transport system substrate-binding protein
MLRLSALVFAMLTLAAPASAAEIRLLVSGASKAMIAGLAERFQAQTGHRFVTASDTAGAIQRRMQAGEVADVVVVTPVVIDQLVGAGRMVAGSRRDIARTALGVGVAEGAAVPDIATVDAVKRLIVAARGIAYSDPAAGGTSGTHFVAMVERLGLTAELARKAHPKRGGYAAEFVASGVADVVFHQISEIRPVAGVRIVGPLPAEIGLVTTYSAGLSTAGADKEAARAFLAFLASAEAVPGITAVGMDPVAAR